MFHQDIYGKVKLPLFFTAIVNAVVAVRLVVEFSAPGYAGRGCVATSRKRKWIKVPEIHTIQCLLTQNPYDKPLFFFSLFRFDCKGRDD